MRITKKQLRRIIQESLPPWMIDAIQKREEQEERRHEQGRRLPLYAPPPPEMPEEEEEEEPPRDSTIIDYRLAKEARTVRATKRQLKRIIKEEKLKLQEAGPLPDGWDDPSADDIIDGYYNAINQMVHEEWAAAAIDLTAPDGAQEVEYVKQALQNLLADLEAGQF